MKQHLRKSRRTVARVLRRVAKAALTASVALDPDPAPLQRVNHELRELVPTTPREDWLDLTQTRDAAR